MSFMIAPARPEPWCIVMLFVLLSGACSNTSPAPADVENYLAARDFYYQGDLDQATDMLGRIRSRGQRFHPARMLEAKILFFRGNWIDARRILERLLRTRPNYPEAELWLIRTMQAEGELEGAESRLREALEYDPGNPRLLHLAGLLKLEKGDMDAALELLGRAKDFSSELANSFVESARLFHRFGFREKALEDLSKAQAMLPADSTMTKPLLDLERILQGGGR